ncbi:MAG: hypothetical protein U0X73_01435 [Thermoanaerobaculia bacterium]
MRSAAFFATALHAAVLAAGPAGGAAGVAPAPLRADRLVEQVDRHLGQMVEIDIVEPLSGPSTPEQLARVEFGQVRVEIPDASGAQLSLVPRTFRLDDPNRYRQRFDRVLASPLRVRGDLLEDPELKAGKRRALVLRVESVTLLPPAPVVKVASVAELLADRERFDRATIELEGDYASRFEVSALAGEIWLEAAPGAKVLGTPSHGFGTRRVRVVGTLFAKPGARYGHMGGYAMLLVAREIEYL